MKKLYGAVAPIITPLTDKHTIDVQGLENSTEYLIKHGFSCLYPCGTTGEMMYLSVDERKLVAETVVKKAGGRVPVFVHIGAWNLKDTLELADHAVKSGADGIGVVTPSFFALTDEALFEFYKTVSENVPENFPVYLYAIPQNAVNDISPVLAEKIADVCPNIVGIKYSYPNMSRIQKFMTIRNGNFSVLCGPDELYEVTVCAGGDGTVSGNSQCIPEHYAALTKALERKDYERATKIQRRTNSLNSILCERNNIASYKAVLCEQGIIKTRHMRKPMMELSAEETENLMVHLQNENFHEVLG